MQFLVGFGSVDIQYVNFAIILKKNGSNRLIKPQKYLDTAQFNICVMIMIRSIISELN